MRISTLIENTTLDDELQCEHGLSLYIEVGARRILLDGGQTGAIVSNAERLGIDLRQVDTVVLSHGHYDHGNGLLRFLEVNDFAPIYMSRYASEAHFNGNDKDIGLDSKLLASKRIVFVDEEMQLGTGIWLKSHGDEACKYPIDSAGLTVGKDNPMPEDFRHELYLIVEENGRKYCFSGCCHKGVLNVMAWFEPDVMIGGFHFKAIAPDSDRLIEAAQVLCDYQTAYYTGHCTGTEQFSTLKRFLGDRIQYLSTGTTVTF